MVRNNAAVWYPGIAIVLHLPISHKGVHHGSQGSILFLRTAQG